MATSQNPNPNPKQKQQVEHRNWAELNGDILLLIFGKLVTIDVLMSGVVCRSWRKVAKDEPELWRRIDMRNLAVNRGKAKKKAWTLKDLTKLAIDRSKGKLEEFWIQYFGDEYLLQYLCDRTSVLKSLRLIACFSIFDEDIVKTVKKQPLLEELQIGSPYIEHLDQLEEEEEEEELLNLKQFKFDTCTLYPTSNDDVAFVIAQTMHQLRYIQLIRTGVTNRGLTAILEGCPFLETLDIRACYYVEMDSDMRARCARLETVRLPLDSLDDYEYEAEAHYDSEDEISDDFVLTGDPFFGYDYY
ncbi:hypothetical protein LUZ60_008800 [Juncus effusus]|nr:hypothetical protein LUZ60_008800 [Juncus effusus]